MAPAAKPPERGVARRGRQRQVRRSALALVEELTEALTAITAYLEAARHRESGNTPSARAALQEAHEKSLKQLSRAADLLRGLREKLRENKDAGDK